MSMANTMYYNNTIYLYLIFAPVGSMASINSFGSGTIMVAEHEVDSSSHSYDFASGTLSTEVDLLLLYVILYTVLSGCKLLRRFRLSETTQTQLGQHN